MQPLRLDWVASSQAETFFAVPALGENPRKNKTEASLPPFFHFRASA
jgi:hypothetical protein